MTFGTGIYYTSRGRYKIIEEQLGIADFDEIWHERSFRKNIQPVFFLSAMVDVEGVKTTLKIEGVKHFILLNISEIIEDIVFV